MITLRICAVLIAMTCITAIPDSKYEKKYYPPMPYDFNYGVKDDYKGLNYDRNEKSDGKTVQGSYTIQLPDGRLQTVQYTADHDRGFVAHVSYRGTAEYPPHAKHPPFTVKPKKYH